MGEMLTFEEARARLRVSAKTLWSMLKDGRFAGVAVKLGLGRGVWRFDSDRLETWLAGWRPGADGGGKSPGDGGPAQG